MRSFSGFLAVLAVCVGLVGCNDKKDETPDTVSDNCRVYPTEMGSFLLDFDRQKLILTKELQAIDASSVETWRYASLEDFVDETDRVNLGTYVERDEILDTELHEEREYADDGRLLHAEVKYDEFGLVEVHTVDFDTWDEHGRPTRGFAVYVSQLFSDPETRCESIELDYAYDDEANRLTTVEKAGVDPDGAACEGEITRETFDAYGNRIGYERWNDSDVDIASTPPDSDWEREYDIISTETVCY